MSQQVIPPTPTNSQYNPSSIDFRRYTYQQDLWVTEMEDSTRKGQEVSTDFSRCNIRVSPRLVPWLRREIEAFYNNDFTLANYIVNEILDLIIHFPMLSPYFRTAIIPYMGPYTDHFIHEFFNFSQSSYDMDEYDMRAKYLRRNYLAYTGTQIAETNNSNVMTHADEDDEDSDSDVQIVGVFSRTSNIPTIQLDSDSDEEGVGEVTSSTSEESTLQPIQEDSDSDGCEDFSVKAEHVRKSYEVITLESELDDDTDVDTDSY